MVAAGGGVLFVFSFPSHDRSYGRGGAGAVTRRKEESGLRLPAFGLILLLF